MEVSHIKRCGRTERGPLILPQGIRTGESGIWAGLKRSGTLADGRSGRKGILHLGTNVSECIGERWFNNVTGELRQGPRNQRQIMSWEAGQRQEIKLEGDPGSRSQRTLDALYSRDTYCSPNIAPHISQSPCSWREPRKWFHQRGVNGSHTW